jgi:hypothetical protein
MKWEIAPKQRVDLACFGGINLSGERRLVDIQVVNGRQGPDVPSSELKSLVLIAPIGTRVLLKTHDGDDWEQHAWRAIRVMKGKCFATKEGRTAVRVPDLDWFDAPDARRTDPDVQESFPQAATLAEGSGWTFGREGELKGRVVVVAIDRE